MTPMRLLSLCALAALTVGATAAETPTSAKEGGAPTQPAPPPPPIPETDRPPESDPTAEELQPEVRITTKGDEVHEEYRVNGRLYMIKVTPAKGPPYYLIDREGSGNFERTNLGPEVNPPTWVIKQW